MYIKKYFNLFLLVLIVFCGSNFLFAQTGNSIKKLETIDVAGSSGVVVHKEGLVYVKRANTDYWQQVELYARLYPLDTIQTDKNSICEIKLYGDHVLRLEPSSNFSFAERNPGIDRWAFFKLNAGKIWIKIVNDSPNADSFILETPHASISVKGTVFSVEAPHGKVVAYEGVVQVAQGNRAITVNAGEQTRINSIGFMTNPESLDAESISEFEGIENKVVYLDSADIQEIKRTIIVPSKKTLTSGMPVERPLKAEQENNQPFQATTLNENILDKPAVFVPEVKELMIPELLISKDKTLSILDDSLLFRNPAILSKLPMHKMNTVYYASKWDSSIESFNKNYAKNSFISDPNKVNSGLNERIEENQILGVRTLERETGIGVHFNKQRYLQMISSSNANLYQNNILNFFYGKSFQVEDKTSVGLLIRGSVINSTQQNIINFDSNFENIFDSGDESSDFYYGLDLGLLHMLSHNFYLGLSYKGLFAHDLLGIEGKNDNSLFLSFFYFNEFQITELSIKNNQDFSSLLVNNILQIPLYQNILFTFKAEFSSVFSMYSFMTNIETSPTFQLFLKYTIENMKLVADNSTVIVGGQLDF